MVPEPLTRADQKFNSLITRTELSIGENDSRAREIRNHRRGFLMELYDNRIPDSSEILCSEGVEKNIQDF